MIKARNIKDFNFLLEVISGLFLISFSISVLSFAQITEVQKEVKRQIEVPADAGWVDTGLEVKEGEVFEFVASGTISCQKGNLVANCGPEGLDLQTVQQPMTDKNLGALVGKVVKVISVSEDPDTGEEIREEVAKVFYIGERATVEMPLDGRLYLGVNDNVFADNEGKFLVIFSRKEKNTISLTSNSE